MIQGFRVAVTRDTYLLAPSNSNRSFYPNIQQEQVAAYGHTLLANMNRQYFHRESDLIGRKLHLANPSFGDIWKKVNNLNGILKD